MSESLLVSVVAVWIGGLFGASLGYLSAECPPLPIVPRVLAWLFFVSLGMFAGYAIKESA